jgi:hypothetical protein
MSLTGSGSLDPGLNEGANQGSTPSGGGDMYKATYDSDNDSVVDDAERLGGQLPAYYATAADLAYALAQALAAQVAITAHEALSNPHGTSLEQVRAVSNAITARITGSGLFTGNFIDLNNSDYGGTKTVLKSGNTVLVLGDTDAYFTDAAALFGLYINTVSGISQLYNDYGAITLNPDGSISAGNGELKDVANPTLGTSAVNKNYADGLIVGLEAQSNKNQNNGYAGLDNNGLIPSTLLPSYVDDVLEFANLAAFPVTGENEKVYTALDTFKIYRWSGSIYVEISPSPGSTDDVPEGSVNKYFQESRVLGTILAGLSVASSAIITAADSVLSAIGKLQAQITANLSTLTTHTSNSSNPHSVTKAQVGLSNVPNVDSSNPANITQSSSYRFTTDAEKAAWNAKLDAGDATVTNSRRLRFVGSTSQALCASTATDEVLYAVQLETLAVGDIFEFFCQLTCTSSANSKVYKAWLNTTANLSGSPVQIAQLSATTNIAAATFQRRYGVRSSTSLVSAYAAGTSFSNPYANSTVLPSTISSLPDMTTTCYIIISANRANSGDTVGAEWFMVRVNRQ